MLRTSDKFLTKHTKKLIYHSHILSHIINGLLLWGNMVDNTTLNKIQKCLNRCYTLIKHQQSTPQNLKRDEYLSIYDLLKVENCKLVFKHKHKLLPFNIQSLLMTDSCNKTLVKDHTYNTRHKQDLNLPSAKHKAYHNSYLVSAIKENSSLPIPLKNETKLGVFIRKLKQYLLE